MYPLLRILICEYMGKSLANCENVTFCELPEAVSNVIRSFPLEYTAYLDLFVLVELGKEVFGPIFLQQQRRVFGFGYAEWQYFHRLKIAKYYLNT